MPWINCHRRVWLGLLGILVGMELLEGALWLYDATRGGGDGRLKGFAFGSIFQNLRFAWVGMAFISLGLLVPNQRVQNATFGVLTTVLLLGLLEGLAAVVVEKGLVRSSSPSYSFAIPLPLITTNRPFLADVHPAFGVWHYADSAVHESACFRQVYHKNAFGARDRERNLRSARPRTVVLGDSFVEGYGVSQAERFTDRLEAAVGKEMLNFGTSGHFGPTQAYLQYRHLARWFDHQNVVLCVLPWNDFAEDDYELCRSLPAFATRYRPYWVGHPGTYQLRYWVDSLPKSDWYPDRIRQVYAAQQRGQRPEQEISRTALQKLIHGLESYSYLYNLIHSSLTSANPPSRFFHYQPEEYERLLHSIRRLKTEVGRMKLFVVTLPTRNDFQEATPHFGKSPLATQLAADLRRESIGYVDLLETMLNRQPDWNTLFFSCDGHWNAVGHALAAECLRTHPALSSAFSPEK